MTTYQSFQRGVRASAAYFVSTFLFGVMFGLAAAAANLEQWQSLLMSFSVFSASAQFVALEFWQAPLPLATIALSVLLVSTRNILLGMSMTYHFDGHSMGRRIVWLFVLNDPGVVTSFRQPEEVDRLGYITGYGLSLMTSWMLSSGLGFQAAHWLGNVDMAGLRFAGPLIIATMMMLFVKGTNSSPVPWIVSGISALLLVEIGAADYLVLLLAVLSGVVVAMYQQRSKHA